MKKIKINKVAKGNIMNRDVTVAGNKLEITQVEAAPVETREVTQESTATTKKKKEKTTPEYDFVQDLEKSGEYAVSSGVLYKWEDNYWKVMPNDCLRKAANVFLGGKVTAPKAKSCCDTALTSLPELPEVEKGRVIIPCKEWYIEMIDGEIKWRKPHPSYGMTHVINTNMAHENKKGMKFHTYLEKAIDDQDVRLMLQEYVGYTLINDCRFETALFLYGKGANGKSVFLEIVRALHRQAKAFRLDKLSGFELGGIIGASLLSSDETPNGKIDTDNLKAIISGNEITIRKLYSNPVDYRNTAKMIVSGNHYPSFDDGGNGTWRRWIFVPFKNVVPVEERNLMLSSEIIDEELDVVLAWAIEGLTRLLKNGKFTSPKSLEVEKERIRSEMNPIKTWLSDEPVSQASEHNILKTDVYEKYMAWAEENHQDIMSSPSFWKGLKNSVNFEYTDKQKKCGGKVKRYVNLNFQRIGAANDEDYEVAKVANCPF